MADIVSRADLDMKPRRLVPRALENIRRLKAEGAVPLSEIAEVLENKVDLLTDIGSSEFRRVVEGQDIRAIEGLVVPHYSERCWEITDRKQRKMYQLRDRDIIVGLVRPERRNIGILLDHGNDVVGSPDGLAVAACPRREGARISYGMAFCRFALRAGQASVLDGIRRY